MNIPCQARVLVVDNDPKTRSQLVEILRGSGFKVMAIEGQGLALQESAKIIASSFKPHVVVMDLRLLDEREDDRSGLELWKDKSFENSRCILYSAYLNQDYRITREALRQSGVDDVIGKEDSPQNLIDAIERAARQNCACGSKLVLEWPSAWNEEAVIKLLLNGETTVPIDTVTDVLGRLFSDGGTLTLKTLDGAASSSISVGRGRAILFQASLDDKEPVVIKLAQRERIVREVDAYNQYIKDRLAGRFSAELQKHILGWDLGGISYSFMGSSLKSIETFAAFYQQSKDPGEIIRPLQHFFGEVWRRNYNDTRTALTGTLFEAYDRFLKLRQRLEELAAQEKILTVPGLPGGLPNPARWILQHEADSRIPSAHQSVTHGDLHGDNLFVEGQHAWAIDFERTGPGPILRDFVELEQDIVTRLTLLPEDNLQLFYEFAMILSMPTSQTEPFVSHLHEKEIHKALEVIRELRSLAHEITSFRDMREYYWGLLLDTYFGILLAEKYSNKWWRGLIFSAILCARLKHWRSEWPPEPWGWTSPQPVNSRELNQIQDPRAETSLVEANLVQAQASEGQSMQLRLLGAGISFLLATLVVVILWQGMQYFRLNLDDHIATLLYLAIFAVIAFGILGLIKGPEAIDALLKIISSRIGQKGGSMKKGVRFKRKDGEG